MPMQETQVQSLSGRSPGGGNGNPFQYSFPENPMDRGLQSMGLQRQGLRHTCCFKAVCRSPLVPLDGRCVSEEDWRQTGLAHKTPRYHLLVVINNVLRRSILLRGWWKFLPPPMHIKWHTKGTSFAYCGGRWLYKIRFLNQSIWSPI